MIEGTRCGYLCSSVDEYTAAINKVTDSMTVREEMGKSSLQRIKQFEMQVVIDNLVDLYSKEFVE